MSAADEELITTAELARLFGVGPKTLGGHRRYRRSDVLPLVQSTGRQAS